LLSALPLGLGSIRFYFAILDNNSCAYFLSLSV